MHECSLEGYLRNVMLKNIQGKFNQHFFWDRKGLILIRIITLNSIRRT